MNRRFCVWVGSILALFSFARITAGQTPPPEAAASSIPLQALGASDETPYNAAITKFVQEELTLLTGEDFSQQTAARNKFKTELSRGNSPAYYAAFAKAWTTTATAVIAKNPSIPARVNIAIVTSYLADASNTLDAQPMVLLLLKDREPAIMLWGIKAARPLILVLVQGENPAALTASPLPPAVVAAVKKCGDLRNEISDVSGFAAADAYAALAVTVPGKEKDLAINAIRPLLVRPLLDIVQIRIDQHAKGAVQMPGAERAISTWLSGIYPDLTPVSEQRRLVQLLVDLVTDVGIRADLYQYKPKELSQIRAMLQYVASALKVIANRISSGAIGSKLDWLTGMGPAADVGQIKDHTTGVFAAMSLVIHDLSKPPEIPTIEPPPPPTTKPAANTPGTPGAPGAPTAPPAQ